MYLGHSVEKGCSVGWMPAQNLNMERTGVTCSAFDRLSSPTLRISQEMGDVL